MAHPQRLALNRVAYPLGSVHPMFAFLLPARFGSDRFTANVSIRQRRIAREPSLHKKEMNQELPVAVRFYSVYVHGPGDTRGQ